MLNSTDDLRIVEITALTPPSRIIDEIPRDEAVTATVTGARNAVHNILHGEDDRLIVVIGPCSIHDPAAAFDYAARLKEQRNRFADELARDQPSPITYASPKPAHVLEEDKAISTFPLPIQREAIKIVPVTELFVH